MKKYLFIALAALGFAACEEKIGDQPHSGEVEQSYIAVSLSASDLTTRANDGVYQEGLEAERAVETAYFFFFKDNGDPFPVNVTDGSVDKPSLESNATNYLNASLTTTTGENMDNVSDIKNVVLLLSSYVGDFPKQIVAVLNWVPTNKTYTLNNLKESLTDVRNNSEGDIKGKFIMSNAVYAKDGNAVYATPLTADNIFTDEVNAKANPVTIYVERAAAKVTVTTTDGKTKFNLNKPVVIGGNSIEVYANILGWELYNDYQQSYLIKNIDPNWTNDNLGFTWNDSPWYRCYWASSQNGAFTDNEFSYEYATSKSEHYNKYGYGFGNKTDVANGTYADKTYTYCGENTGREAKDRTKIILKAQLQKENNDPVELARWYTTEYLGEVDLRTAVANTLKYTLYYKEGENYIGLKPEDLQCVSPYDENGTPVTGAPSGIKSYQVFFQLSTTAETKTWYKNESGNKTPMSKDSSTDPYGKTATNEYLSANVKPAELYKSGQTYYYIDIQHLGNVNDTETQIGEYGIVRNHIYSININGIGGYGSPIYIGTSNIVTPPDPYEPGVGGGDDKSYVSAEVQVLLWRLVSQEVNITPNN